MFSHADKYHCAKTNEEKENEKNLLKTEKGKRELRASLRMSARKYRKRMHDTGYSTEEWSEGSDGEEEEEDADQESKGKRKRAPSDVPPPKKAKTEAQPKHKTSAAIKIPTKTGNIPTKVPDAQGSSNPKKQDKGTTSKQAALKTQPKSKGQKTQGKAQSKTTQPLPKGKEPVKQFAREKKSTAKVQPVEQLDEEDEGDEEEEEDEDGENESGNEDIEQSIPKKAKGN